MGETREAPRCPYCGEDRLIEFCRVLVRWECAVCGRHWRIDRLVRLGPRED